RKLLLLVCTALGFLVTPASGGGTSCGHKVPGHCRMHCGPREKTMFTCDRNKQCCVKDFFIPEPMVPPPVHRPKKPCRTGTASQTQK
uniref:Beta-defensin n=1 Tax=Sus scrofa TaxID=9823 RepID=A0A8D1M0X6_PIG